jgi:hypothetical protein
VASPALITARMIDWLSFQSENSCSARVLWISWALLEARAMSWLSVSSGVISLS